MIIALILLAPGCTRIHKIDLTSETSTINETNTHLENHKTKITLTNGHTIAALSPQITADSVSWLNPAADSRYSLAVSEIKNINIRKRGRGAWDGFKIGAILGGITGLLIGGIANANNKPSSDQNLPPLPLALIGAAGAGLIGLPIGAAAGSKDKYILTAPKDSSLSNYNNH